jgi:hypothetical protein
MQGLVARQSAVTAQQLVGVEVGRHDEQVDGLVARRVDAREGVREHALDPGSAKGPAAGRHLGGDRLPGLLPEQEQSHRARALIVVHEGMDSRRRSRPGSSQRRGARHPVIS